jgi:hypothetical protein
LVDEDFSCFCTQIFDFIFSQLDWFPWPVATYYEPKKQDVSEVIDNQEPSWIKDKEKKKKTTVVTMTLMDLMTPSDDPVKEVAWQWRQESPMKCVFFRTIKCKKKQCIEPALQSSQMTKKKVK